MTSIRVLSFGGKAIFFASDFLIRFIPPLHMLPWIFLAESQYKAPISSNQRGRPSQVTSPFSSTKVIECASELQKRWNIPDATSVIVFTYMTDLPQPWILGLSAALHGVPLVIAGHGMRWDGTTGQKIPASRRVAQILHSLHPRATVIYADGSDTAINDSPQRIRPLLPRLWENVTHLNESILVSGECGSWPKCYKKQYEKVAAYRSCRAVSHACYPNTGAYLGKPLAIMRLLSELQKFAQLGDGVEHGDDQAAANRLLLSNTPKVDMVVDYQSEIFVSLYGCKHPTIRTFYKNWTLCHDGSFDPLRRIQRKVDNRLTFDTSKANNRSSRSQPFLLHANGIHDRLAKAYFGIHSSPANVGAKWRSLLLPSQEAVDRAFRHPVLMIDSAKLGVCSVTTLGKLIRIS